MLNETILDHSPVWLIYAGTVLLLLAGNETGFRLGTWRRRHMPEGEKTPASAIMGSTLGLLAFMLAFTFGMSGARFDARKQLVLDEASAVLRAYQRAQFLPEPQRSECSRLLREYVDLRVGRRRLESMSEVAGTGDALGGRPGRAVEGGGPWRTGPGPSSPSSCSRCPS